MYKPPARHLRTCSQRPAPAPTPLPISIQYIALLLRCNRIA